MKRMGSLFLVLMFCFTLCACDLEETISSNEVETSGPMSALDLFDSQTPPAEAEENLEEFFDSYEGKRFRSLYDGYGIRGWDEIYDQTPHSLSISCPPTFKTVKMGVKDNFKVIVPLPDPDQYEDAIDNSRSFALDTDRLYALSMGNFKGDKSGVNHLRGRENEGLAEYAVSFHMVTLSGVELFVSSKVYITFDDPYSYDDWCESVAGFFDSNDRYPSRDKSSNDVYTAAFDGYTAGLRIVNDESGLMRDIDLCYSTNVCQFLSELNKTGEIYNSVGYAIDIRIISDVVYNGSAELTDKQIEECKEMSESCIRAFEEFIFNIYGMGSELANVYNNTANFNI